MITDLGHKLVCTLAQEIKKEQFAYSVEVDDRTYDVYHGHHNGVRFTIAFLINERGTVEIPVCRKGHLQEEAVSKDIRESVS